jgi:hypothetical protein
MPTEGKHYTILGMMFVTSVNRYDESGKEIESQEGVVFKLLRESQRLGGNDILNLRTEEKVAWVETTVEPEGLNLSLQKVPPKVVKIKVVTVTGTALAIKYID